LLLLQTVHPNSNHHQAGALLIAMQFEAYLNQALRRSEFPHFLLRFEDTDDDGPRRVVQDTLQRPAHAGDYQRQLHFGGRIYELTLAPTPAYLQQQRGWQAGPC
jgi:hypothetical protein